mmetsp:Transcript_25643/g.79749  ORF Transcript_25643/g.79749 Transcript_25643/m.79749 type:complete len:266 (+) Transcript_25643:16-813(+)
MMAPVMGGPRLASDVGCLLGHVGPRDPEEQIPDLQRHHQLARDEVPDHRRRVREVVLLAHAPLRVRVREAPHEVLPLGVAEPDEPHEVRPGAAQLHHDLLADAQLQEAQAGALLRDPVAEVQELAHVALARVVVHGLQVALVQRAAPELLHRLAEPLEVAAPAHALEDVAQEAVRELLVVAEDRLPLHDALELGCRVRVGVGRDLPRELLALFVAATHPAVVLRHALLVLGVRRRHLLAAERPRGPRAAGFRALGEGWAREPRAP